MKASQVYKIVQGVLAPFCARYQFAAVGKPDCCWSRAQQAGHVVLWVPVDAKHDWSPVTGGQLYFRAMFCDRPKPRWEAGQWRFHFLQTFLSEGDIASMASLRRTVLSKLISHECDNELDRMLHSMAVAGLRLARDSQILRHQDEPLPYLDSEDVWAWARFIRNCLPLIDATTRPWPVGAHIDEWAPPY